MGWKQAQRQGNPHLGCGDYVFFMGFEKEKESLKRVKCCERTCPTKMTDMLIGVL
jgi:hypothetical protein